MPLCRSLPSTSRTIQKASHFQRQSMVILPPTPQSFKICLLFTPHCLHVSSHPSSDQVQIPVDVQVHGQWL